MPLCPGTIVDGPLMKTALRFAGSMPEVDVPDGEVGPWFRSQARTSARVGTQYAIDRFIASSSAD
jgi:hypothetical protein